MSQPFYKKAGVQAAIVTGLFVLIAALLGSYSHSRKSETPVSNIATSGNNSPAVNMSATVFGSNSPVIQTGPGSTVNATINYGSQNLPRQITKEQTARFLELSKDVPKAIVRFTVDAEDRESDGFYKQIHDLLIAAGYTDALALGRINTGPHPVGLGFPLPTRGTRNLNTPEYFLLTNLKKVGIQISPFPDELYVFPPSNTIHLIIGEKPTSQ